MDVAPRMILSPRQSEILRLVRRHGPLSRRDVHRFMRLRPNTVGELVAEMISQGVLREIGERILGRGRPHQLLEIDTQSREVVGLALEAGRVGVCRLNLAGRPSGACGRQAARSSRELIAAACSFLKTHTSPRTLAIGISSTGFVDPLAQSILVSSATFRQSTTSLKAVYARAGNCPVLLENNMHALAACWLMNRGNDLGEDVLLAYLDDGAIGAALLVAGQPNRGCVSGGNELGHMRLPVETERCYCGQTGCLERICSTKFLRRLGGNPRATLPARLAAFDPHDAPLIEIVRHLAGGLANVVNFIRPNRLVVTGRLAELPAFADHLLAAVRGLLFAPLRDRVQMELWQHAGGGPAEIAAWLALATIYQGPWAPPVGGAEPPAAGR
jgi:predicted NBD/HSP70 family sugar kinase